MVYFLRGVAFWPARIELDLLQNKVTAKKPSAQQKSGSALDFIGLVMRTGARGVCWSCAQVGTGS